MREKVFPILAAGFGGMAPNLLSLGIRLSKENATWPEETYYVAMIIFAAIGAVVAMVWQEKDLRKAFYLGIGLPSLIQVTVTNNSLKPIAVNEIDAPSLLYIDVAKKMNFGAGFWQAIGYRDVSEYNVTATLRKLPPAGTSKTPQ